jgi:Malectin domain/Family of unknown function (DUF6519)
VNTCQSDWNSESFIKPKGKTMSFDTSRYTFDPWNDFTGVVMPQGRVQLDSDWNELLAEFGRRIRAGTLDIVGRAAVPITTKNGFKIVLAQSSTGGSSFSIGQGRMYVDGLLAENHGLPAPAAQKWIPASNSAPKILPFHELPAWDSALDEFVGTEPVNYNQQPYFPNADAFAPFPQSGGPYLVYLDVWQRDVTFLEHPDLVEKAVGVDTAGRLQTVWQVKWLDVSDVPGVNCSTPDSQIPGWAKLLLPPGPRLTTGVVQSSPSGPCCLTPNMGYTGLENQHYRLEIHDKGQAVSGKVSTPIGSTAAGTATFKWSRDSASVATAVTGIQQGGKVLTVQSTGKDDVLRFSANDWVEITDDWLELRGLPGELHQVTLVSDQTKTITLATAVSLANFPVNTTGQTDPTRNTRLTRWDQRGKIYESDGATVWADLDVLGSGAIPVPPPGTSLILESGIIVSFDLVPNATSFNTGDYWTFAARATDGTVEYLDQAPPRGIYHHYARLSVVSLSSARLSEIGTLALQDQSKPPVDFLTFQSTPVTGWPPNFGVVTQANPVNPANFDLQVVYAPAKAEGVIVPVTVESFTNLSLNSNDPNYAQTVINKQSQLIMVPSTYTPPLQTPVFSPSGSTTIPLKSLGTIQLHDTSSSPVTFLTLQTKPLANWLQNFAVSATPFGSTNFTLEISYAPPGQSAFATLERFENLSLPNVSSEVQSEFISNVTPFGSPPPSVSALNLVTLADCRTFWPLVAGGNCDCTILINPGDLDDSNTLQDFLDQYQNMSTETVICFSPGTYSLTTPLRLTAAHSNLTLKACQEGTVVLQAKTGNENQFNDGLIVLDNAKNVTLQGLTFSIPLAPFAQTSHQFAGLPISSFAPYVQSAVNKLAVSVALRPISCSSLTIENCRFEFPDLRSRYRERANLFFDTFGVGIFAGGVCDGLELIGNVFEGGPEFGVGFLLCPAVAFTPPSINLAPSGFHLTAARLQGSLQSERALIGGQPLTTAGSLGQPSPVDTNIDFNALTLVSAAGGGQVLAATLDQAVFEKNSFTGLSIPTLIIGECGTVCITNNKVDNCIGGFWLLSPLEAGLLSATQVGNLLLIGCSIALGYPLPRNVVTTPSPVAPAPAPVRVYTGNQNYTDSQGNLWTPDTMTNGLNIGGGQSGTPTTHAIANAQPGSTDQALYQDERYGSDFTYTFTGLANGYYTVTLKFAEIAFSTAGARLFNILINGVQVSTNLDIFAAATGEFIAYDQRFPNIAAKDGQIVIEFVAVTNQAKISAVEIDPEWAVPGMASQGDTFGSLTSEFKLLLMELLTLGQQAFANLAVSPFQLRVTENEMNGLRAVAVLVLGEDQIQNGKVSSLMLNGNRLSGDVRLRSDSQLVPVNAGPGAFGPYLEAVAAVASVTRCIATGNMILNTAGAKQRSFILDDRAIPAPQLVVMSNLLKGFPWVIPDRSFPNAPAPMNSWGFLNTTIS